MVFATMILGTMVFYKWLTAGVLVCLLVVLCELGRTGRKLAKTRRSGIVPDDALLDHHRSMGKATLCLSVTAVFLIEFMVRISPDPYSVSVWLYWLNVISGVSWLLLFIVILVWFNGRDFPLLHARLVYSDAALLSVAILTGIPMLYELPLPR